MSDNEYVKNANEGLIQAINEFIENQDFHHLVTPLKDVEAAKRDQRRYLDEAILHNPMLTSIETALSLIEKDLKLVASPEESERVFNELAKSNEVLYQHASAYQENLSKEENPDVMAKDASISMQQAFGISDESMITFYQLGSYYLEKKEIDSAKSMMNMLLCLAPHITNFWAAVGICYQNADDYVGALEFFKYGALINESHLACCIYAANCYLKLGDHLNAKEMVKEAESRLAKSDQAQRDFWQPAIDLLKKQI